MGIRFYCPNGHKLNVKDFQAGKRGICPYCEVRFRIPRESQIPRRNKHRQVPALGPAIEHAANPFTGGAQNPSSKLATEVVSSAGNGATEKAPNPGASWYVRPPSGGQFGPAEGSVFLNWIDEGRVSCDTLVWREGWQEWQSAGAVFPGLGAAAKKTVANPNEPPDPPTSVHSADSETERSGANGSASDGRPSSRRRTSSAKSIAAIVFLAVLAATLLVVLVFLMQNS